MQSHDFNTWKKTHRRSRRQLAGQLQANRTREFADDSSWAIATLDERMVRRIARFRHWPITNWLVSIRIDVEKKQYLGAWFAATSVNNWRASNRPNHCNVRPENELVKDRRGVFLLQRGVVVRFSHWFRQGRWGVGGILVDSEMWYSSDKTSDRRPTSPTSQSNDRSHRGAGRSFNRSEVWKIVRYKVSCDGSRSDKKRNYCRTPGPVVKKLTLCQHSMRWCD